MVVKGLQCDLCGEEGRYTCPRCEARSCSLQCVKQHKKLAGCDGVRKRLKYIPLKDFTELDLVQDYRVLEAASSQVDKCRRDKLKRSTRQGFQGFCAPRIAKSLKKLQYEASRFGTKVKILPPHFVRRKNNSSHFDAKTKSLLWDLELQFPNLSKTVQLKTIPDRTKLWTLLTQLMEPDAAVTEYATGNSTTTASDVTATAGDAPRTAGDVTATAGVVTATAGDAPATADDATPTTGTAVATTVAAAVSGWTSDELDLYRAVGYGGVILYLRCEASPYENQDFRQYENPNSRYENQKRNIESTRNFYRLDMKRSLRYNLRDKVLVEHPVIHVVMRGEECNYREDADMFRLEDTVKADEGSEAEGGRYSREKGRYSREEGRYIHHPESIGMVLDAEDNMAADPEAYKQYFDFYLKYYTQKFARQAPPRVNNPPPPLPTNVHHQPPQLPSAFHQLGNFSQPPPGFSSPLAQPRPSPSFTAPTENLHQSKFQKLPAKPDLSAVNKSNVENARKLQAEIREENKGLGLSGLVAYEDSDSE